MPHPPPAIKRRRRPYLKLKACEPPVASETQIAGAGDSLMRLLGYTVLVLGAYKQRSKCNSCGAWDWPTGGYGNSPGAPDRMVTHPRWPANMWTTIEYKRPGGARRKEQSALADQGRTVFCESAKEAMVELARFEAANSCSGSSRLADTIGRL